MGRSTLEPTIRFHRHDDTYRALTGWERSVLSRLLEPNFPGRDELRRQLDGALARPIDDNGSLEIRPTAQGKAPVEKRVPTEAEVTDADGMTIHYLLHIVDGMMHELEIYKDDSTRVLRIPLPDELQVVILPP